MAELPLARLDAHLLGVLRFEAVIPALVRVEVGDIFIVEAPAGELRFEVMEISK